MENLKTYKYVHEKRARRERRAASERKPLNAPAPKTFLGMPCKTVRFTVPTKKRQEAVRYEFATKARAAFLKHLAKTQFDRLRAAGITRKDIKLMEKGKTPNGWNTHHKLSVYGGGTNDFSNLLLIKRAPYHDMIHYHLINPQVQGMKRGETRKVVIPNPSESIYVPPQQFKHLERDAKRGGKSYGAKGQSYQDKKQDSPFMQDVKAADAYVKSFLSKNGGR